MAHIKTGKGVSNRNLDDPAPLTDEDIITKRRVTRRSALATLGISLSAGALSTLLEGCVATPMDADPTDGASTNNSRREPSRGSRQRDIKLGDGTDYTVYADYSDLDSDARDSSDHSRTREADRSSYNDYD